MAIGRRRARRARRLGRGGGHRTERFTTHWDDELITAVRSVAANNLTISPPTGVYDIIAAVEDRQARDNDIASREAG